jgi:hypothetical protein
MPRSEYSKWVRFFLTEGPDVTEIQLANLSTMVAKGLGAKDIKIEDFLVRKPGAKQQPEQKVASAESIRAAFSGIANLMS